MTSGEGGFYSSQDADSGGGEGEYYVWTDKEIQSLLGEEDSNLFFRYYGVTSNGNFEGNNILHVEESAFREQLSDKHNLNALESCRKKLLEARELRPKPGRDEKVLAAWNGLMLRSFAEASRVLQCEDYCRIAVKNAEFLLSKMCSQGYLLRSYKNGRAKFNAYLEDYAFLIDGLLSLYEATFDLRWIRAAEELAEKMTDRFWDPQDKNFFFTPDDHEALIHRPKEIYDNAMPSGNSVAAGALLRLAAFTGNNRWSGYTVAMMENNASLLLKHPNAVSHLLCVLDSYLGSATEIAIIGSPASETVRELTTEVFRHYLPNKTVACGLDGGLPLLENRQQLDNRATVYLCENHVCKQPVTSVEELRRMLGEIIPKR
jgi:uncharacterized protein YyaL (SSP411 family)